MVQGFDLDIVGLVLGFGFVQWFGLVQGFDLYIVGFVLEFGLVLGFDFYIVGLVLGFDLVWFSLRVSFGSRVWF